MKNLHIFSTLIISFFGFFFVSSLFNPPAVSTVKSTSTGIISGEELLLSPYCNVPTWPVTSNITSTSATFSWDPVSGAVSYTVQIREPYGNWYTLPGSPFYNTWATAYNLDPCTTYEWRVRANCTTYGTYSYWTYPVSFTTDGSSNCYAPGWLNTFNITHHTATWEWAPVSNALSYTVQWRVSGGTWYNLGGSWTSTWIEVGGLESGTTYEWRVRSNCCDGQYSPWSQVEIFTTLGFSNCYTPSWTSTTEITQTSAKLKWDAVSGAHSYSVQIRTLYGTWYAVPGSPFYGTWTIVTGLEPCTTYEWRVRANCSGGQYSEWTYPTQFTTICTFNCNKPTGTVTLEITHTSAKFKWNPVSGADNYTVEIRTPYGSWTNVPGSPTYGTWIMANNLQPCTTYEWRVRANCGYYEYSDWTYPVSFTTECTSNCPTPTWTYTSNITTNSATFHWEEVWGAQSYTVQIRLSNGQWYNVQGGPFYNNWVTVYGLDPNTYYCWRVKSNCHNYQYSEWSYQVCFTTLGVSCHPPYWLQTSNITQTSAKLEWSAVSGVYDYHVQWRHPGGTWYDLPYVSNSTWVILYGLQPCTSYEWRVRSICTDWQYSSWSHVKYFTTLCVSCHKPSWTHTTNITQTSATFSWSSESGAQSYSVQLRVINGSWYEVQGSPTSNTFITVDGLSPGTTYEWRVRTNCYNSQYSDWTHPNTFTTLGSVCHAPGWLYTVMITETSARLDWQPVSGAQSYSVQWRTPGGNWNDIGPFTQTWTDLFGLQPGTQYEWHVKTNCYNGLMSDWSVSAFFTTLGTATLCDTPTGLFTTNITDTSATFNWSAVPDAQYYVVQTRVPNGAWNFAPNNPFPGTSATVGGFIPGTTYEWRVQTKCIDGNFSNWSPPVSFTTIGISSTGGEDCDSATVLTVNSECINTSSSNVGATPSSPPPMGWCPTNNYKDVWFKFTMPSDSNPTVTIRTTAGTLTDAIMEVYRGSGCLNLEYIWCEDDNYNGNGGFMPVISVTGTAGETIWVRVWGYAGTTGTFSICVFNYFSANYAVPDELFIPDSGEPAGELTSQVNTNEKVEIIPSLRIAPNPATDILKLTYSQTEESMVTGIMLMDMSGQIILRKEFKSQEIVGFEEQLDVSRLTPGMYVLLVNTSSGILTEKISIIH